MILTGTTGDAMANPNEEELEKRITAKGKIGSALVKVDNVRGDFGNAVWEAVITSRTWNSRELGKSQDLTVPLDMLWIATGNQIALTGDMSRRCIRVAVHSDDERPEERTEFRYPRLLQHICDNRARYVRDVLVILRAYIAAGKPQQGVRLGSFEDWADLVPSALRWLGEPDVTHTRLYYEQTPDSDSAKLRALITAWVRMFGSRKMKTSAVILCADKLVSDEATAMQDALQQFAYGGKDLTAKSLGKRLAHFRGRNIDGRCLEAERDERSDTLCWYVRSLDPAKPIPEPSVSGRPDAL